MDRRPRECRDRGEGETDSIEKGVTKVVTMEDIIPRATTKPPTHEFTTAVFKLTKFLRELPADKKLDSAIRTVAFRFHAPPTPANIARIIG